MRKILRFIAVAVLPVALVFAALLLNHHNRLRYQQQEIAQSVRKLAAEMGGGVLEQRALERFNSDSENYGARGVTVSGPPFECHEVLRRYLDCAEMVDKGYDIKRCLDIVHKRLRAPDEVYCNLVFAESLAADSQ